jgi:hypothetical protein
MGTLKIMTKMTKHAKRQTSEVPKFCDPLWSGRCASPSCSSAFSGADGRQM